MQAYVANWEPAGAMQAFRATPFGMTATHERQIGDTMAAFVCHGLYDRFPSLRVATIENGGMWVPHVLRELEITFGKMPQEFARNPVESFCEHVWVSPFYEDDLPLLKDLIGADHLLFGSDWPHAEGLADPTAFVHDIPGFSPEERQKVMHDNAWQIATRQPA
jgi:predicted TIM-barrel fold metal-dependent hydrolase